MATDPIPEPVPKDIQAKFVQAEWDLMWLAEHGGLDEASEWLKYLRKKREQIVLMERRRNENRIDGPPAQVSG